MAHGDRDVKEKRRKQRKSCQNGGGLGIPPCEGGWPGTVKVEVDAAWLCADSPVIYLCPECVERLEEHASQFDVAVTVLGES